MFVQGVRTMLGIIGVRTVLIGVGLLFVATYFLGSVAADIPVVGSWIVDHRIKVSIGIVSAVLTADGLRCWTFLLRHLPYGWKAAQAARLDGEWKGIQTSNWPLVSQRQNLQEPVEDSIRPYLLETDVSATIKVRIFGTFMQLRSANGYQKSDTVSSDIHDEGPDKGIRLAYIFHATVPKPKPTDEASFFGAANLTLTRQANKKLVLEGPVFTNRDWQNGRNTAGLIRLEKVS